MEATIGGNPDFGDLTIKLAPAESILVESGAMSRMSGNLAVKSEIMGGLFKALIRKLFGGESLFVGRYTAATGPGWISAAPCHSGSVLEQRLSAGTKVYLTAGAFLACTPGIQIRTIFGGLRALFSGEGAFLLECSGEGALWFCAYGAVVEQEIDGELVVDTGHVVAWEPSLTYSIEGVGGLKSTFFSGEGLVMRFRGRGKLWLQSRNLGGLVTWLSPFCVG